MTTYSKRVESLIKGPRYVTLYRARSKNRSIKSSFISISENGYKIHNFR